MNLGNFFCLSQTCDRANQIGAFLTFISIVIAFVIEEAIDKKRLVKYIDKRIVDGMHFLQHLARITAWLSVSLFLAYSYFNINWMAFIALSFLSLIVLGLTATAIILPVYLRIKIRRSRNEDLDQGRRESDADLAHLAN